MYVFNIKVFSLISYRSDASIIVFWVIFDNTFILLWLFVIFIFISILFILVVPFSIEIAFPLFSNNLFFTSTFFIFFIFILVGLTLTLLLFLGFKLLIKLILSFFNDFFGLKVSISFNISFSISKFFTFVLFFPLANFTVFCFTSLFLSLPSFSLFPFTLWKKDSFSSLFPPPLIKSFLFILIIISFCFNN